MTTTTNLAGGGARERGMNQHTGDETMDNQDTTERAEEYLCRDVPYARAKIAERFAYTGINVEDLPEYLTVDDF